MKKVIKNRLQTYYANKSVIHRGPLIQWSLLVSLHINDSCFRK